MALRRTDALSLLFIFLSDVFLFMSLSYHHRLFAGVASLQAHGKVMTEYGLWKIIGINGLDLLRVGKCVGAEALVYL